MVGTNFLQSGFIFLSGCPLWYDLFLAIISLCPGILIEVIMDKDEKISSSQYVAKITITFA